MLCQLCVLCLGKSASSSFFIFNRRSIVDVEKCVDPLLSDIVDIVRNKQSVKVIYKKIKARLRQHNADLFYDERVLHDPNFYRHMICLLYRLSRCRNTMCDQTGPHGQQILTLLMFGCSLLMGGIYGTVVDKYHKMK